MALSINNTVLTIVAVAVGVILVGSVLAPVCAQVMDDLTASDGEGNPIYENGASWASILSVVVVISILGLIIIAVNGYTNNKNN